MFSKYNSSVLILDVRSNWRISNMYIWKVLSLRALCAESVTDTVITIEQAYVVNTIQA